MKVQYADYIGQTVKARYNKECPSEYGDVPMVFEGDINIYKNESGDVRFDDDWDDNNTPFSETFELL